MPALIPKGRILPLIAASALFMEALDSTIIATALPKIAASLGVNPVHLSFAITAYLISVAVFIPLSGWMADRFSARHVFRAAIGVFMLGSILCGLSNSLFELIGARVIQGAGGAMMTPVARLIVLRSVPKSELVAAMLYFTIPALVGPLLGPLVGGAIVTYAPWRWIFFVNIPIGLIGLGLITLYVKDVPQETNPPLDFRGWFYVAIGLASLMFGFESIGRNIVPLEAVLLMLAMGVLLVALYIRHARRASHPVLDLSMFRIASFRVAVIGGFLFRMGVGAIPFLVPLLLQLSFGLSPLQSGALTMSTAAGALAMRPVTPPILRRFGFRRILTANAIICAVFLVIFCLFRPSTPHWLIIACLAAGGFFRTLQFTSINMVGFSEVPLPELSRANTLQSVAQQLSIASGVGLGAVLLHLTLAGRTTGMVAPQDFAPSFIAIAIATLIAYPLFARLPPDVGAEVSGHRPKGGA